MQTLQCRIWKSRLVFFAVLAACFAMLSARQSTAQIRIACVGDSITYGVDVTSSAYTYPADLQAALGSGYNVQNFGYPGLALMNLPQGNPSSHPAYTTTSQYTSMVAFNPNIIIVMLGTNDASFPVDGSGWSADYLSTFISQYESFITSLRNQPAKPTVYIATLPEVYGTNQYGIDPTIANTIITPAIHTIATATGAPLIDVHTAMISESADSSDNVHPNNAGTAVIADAVYTALESPLSTSVNFQIINQTSGMCVTDTNSSTSSGTPLEQTPCGSNQLNQQWKLTSTGNGSFSIYSANATSLAWDDPGGSTANSTLIQLLTGASTTDEEWLAMQLGANGFWTFTNLTSGNCLDDTNGSMVSGTQFQQYACAQNANQQYNLVQVGSGSGSPPTAPSALTATTASSTQINLEWTASTTSGVTYTVYRSTTNGFTPGSGNQIASGITVTLYSNTGLAASTTYYYKVEAVSSAGTSPASNQATANTSAPATLSTTSYYQIVNEASGACIDDTNASTVNGTVLQQYTCYANNVNQEWLFTATSGGYYEVTTYNSGTAAWNVVNSGTVSGTGMQLWAYGGGNNEQFEPVELSSGYYEFIDRNSGLCLYVPNNNNSQQLEINTCNGSTSESFTLNRVSTSAPAAPTLLTASAASSSQINLSWTASTTSGVTYTVYRSTTSGFTPGSGNQVASGLTATTYSDTGLTASTTYYYFVEAVNPGGNSPASNQASATTSASGSGISTTQYYQIVNQASGLCLDDTSGATTNGTVLQQYTCYSNNVNQEWLFTATSGGYYEVTTYNSSTAAWNVVNNGTSPGTGIQLWAYGGGNNEQFEPVKLSSGYYEFIDRNSGLCLSVPNSNNNQQLEINTCNGSTSESFTLNEL